jgi:hypothetical protein
VKRSEAGDRSRDRSRLGQAGSVDAFRHGPGLKQIFAYLPDFPDALRAEAMALAATMPPLPELE